LQSVFKTAQMLADGTMSHAQHFRSRPDRAGFVNCGESPKGIQRQPRNIV
jgi:hypothetical protein